MALKYKSGFLAEFRKAIQVPIKFIHVTRDPFDNIATLLLRYKKSREAVRAEGAKVRRVVKVARSRSFSRHNLLLLHSLVGLACEQALIFVVIKDVARAAKPRVTSRRV